MVVVILLYRDTYSTFQSLYEPIFLGLASGSPNKRTRPDAHAAPSAHKNIIVAQRVHSIKHMLAHACRARVIGGPLPPLDRTRQERAPRACLTLSVDARWED